MCHIESAGFTKMESEQLHTFRKKFTHSLKREGTVSLSDDVAELFSICDITYPEDNKNVLFDMLDELDDEFVIAFEQTLLKKDVNNYRNVISDIAPFLRMIVDSLSAVCPSTFVNANLENLMWVSIEAKEMIRCLEDAQAKQQTCRYASCLLLTAILERSLQDLVFTLDGKTPTILRDLLQSVTLAKALGTTVISFLDILVGPPKSLNIRNLVWHGFGSASEHPEDFSLVIFFALVLIGRKIRNTGQVVTHRPFLKLDVSSIVLDNFTLVGHNTTSCFAEFMNTCKVKSLEITQALQYAEEKKYGRATILLLTSFEHLMRVAFCVYNECPERLTTAVSSEYFTTLDHVFEEKLSDQMSANVLYDVLPSRLRLALSDLLYYPRGLRLRDKLSHLELSHVDITEDIWKYTLNIISATMVYVALHDCLCASGLCLTCNYKPLYHPVAILLRVMEQSRAQITDAKLTAQPPEFLQVLYETSELSILCKKLSQQFTIDKSDRLQLCIVELMFPPKESKQRNLCLSSQFKMVAEWCKWVLAICQNLHEAVKLINEFHASRLEMSEQRTLRSRQRKNFNAFLTHRPALIYLLESLQSLDIDLISAMAWVNYPCVVQKSHKSLLQLCENLLTLIQQNKWSNSMEHCEKFIVSEFR